MRPGESTRPYAFLVSTTGCARGIKGSLGSAAYSYFFVLEALAPVLEEFGTWKLLDRPESSLPFAAAQAEADGYQPIHLALHPPQDVYLTPALPNVLFPFWEFPDIPNRDFEHDTRQNWTRVCSRADLILTACQFTADAFRRGGVHCPIGVVPVPLKPGHFAVPDWSPAGSWTLNCRHVVWGGATSASLKLESSSEAVEDAAPVGAEPALAGPAMAPREGWKRRVFLVARAIFRKVYPWLGTKTLERISRTRYYLTAASGRNPDTREPLPGLNPSLRRLGYSVARDSYRVYVKRWLSLEALDQISRVKVRAFKLLRRDAMLTPDPLLPSTPLTIDGVVFSSIFNLGDRRKNHLDLLTAFLLAFRDRPNVTLVIKLATNPTREHHEINLLRLMYQGLGIDHQCRLVVITDFLTDDQMADLMRVTTYYVNTSKAEGACLPLQQSLAGGRPSIAPDHTAMTDFMDNQVGFVLGTHPEPTYWPHDPEMRIETSWNRLVWSDLHAALIAADDLVNHDFAGYQVKAKAARERMLGYASREIVTQALRSALNQLPAITTGRFAWAS